jgi:hypothetical protein
VLPLSDHQTVGMASITYPTFVAIIVIQDDEENN